MSLVTRDELRSALARAAGRLEGTIDIIVAGGGALLVLTPDARATRDVDLLPTPGVAALRQAMSDDGSIDVNTSVAAFETFLPDGWEGRLLLSEEFSGPSLRVFTPAPEDLAVMKVFRFLAKDAEDIRRLARLEGAEAALFVASGMGATALAHLAVLRPGDHLIVAGPTPLIERFSALY